MNARDISIKTHFILGFVALLIFIAVLSWMAINQNQLLQEQSENILSTSFSAEHATGELRFHVMSIKAAFPDLLSIHSEENYTGIVREIERSRKAAAGYLDDLDNVYKGHFSDIDSLSANFLEWNVLVGEMLKLLPTYSETVTVAKPGLIKRTDIQERKLLKWIDVVAAGNIHKAQEQYQASGKLYAALHKRMWGMIIALSLIMVSIYFFLWKNIKDPLTSYANATRRFSEGDFSARNEYSSKNEFGKISASLNRLADDVQNNIELNNRFARLSKLMLDENDAHRFFRVVLNFLLEKSGAQMGMVYMPDEDTKEFILYESIGAGAEAKQSFSGDGGEGELGKAIATGKLQHVKNWAGSSRFLFYTSAGKVVPEEIITLPIVEEGKTIAVFSFCHTGKFNPLTVDFLNLIRDTLNARVQTVLLMRRMQHFAHRLEVQNHELEVQKNELMQQSAELQEQNAELERQKRKLDEANRFKTSFMSNMSHELRTPLNSVIALTGVLSRRLSGKIHEEEHEYLEVVERNGKHLLTLINDILDLSRIETGKEEVTFCKFNAVALVDDVLHMTSPQAEEKGVTLNRKTENKHIPVESDAGKLRHILINLIGNAIKFTGKGKVEVSVSTNGSFLKIAITDTGIGIAEDNLKKIFDEFQQADSSTSRKYGGTGLGLSIARKYALMLGGDITVKSKLGKGSEFILTVPVNGCGKIGNSQVDTSDCEAQLYPYSELDSAGNTILLVDDSEPAIIQMSDFLSESGYKVLVASGGEEALEIISHTIPDAMVLDLMMPTVDGFQVLKSLREAETTAHVPVLILTAKHITKEELAFLRRNNVHQLIQKGDVKREDLLRQIRMLVDKVPGDQKEPSDATAEVKKKVLVVEDNPDNLTTIRALLFEKYEVVEAINGIRGVEMAGKLVPDVILMDIALPGMNGIEAFEAIRKEHRLDHIPVVALTASAFANDKEEILSHGFDGYIAKPIEYNELITLLEAVLNGKQKN